ncbi:polysaccharide deacetylase family protein [Granulicoccus sp. GXG6511]|uniref:polysaccharide deacetylase family protein n=1 Tax=Granulicoccus sp. GXG6511 TaxID=3381351 RepID=UPI003D7D7708
MRRRLPAIAALLLAAVLVLGAGAYKLVNSRTVQIAGELVARVNTTEKVVALTFDDGPTGRVTDAILRTLAEHDVPATFFVVGESVAADPRSARAIVAGGHQLANHSWSHPRMVLLGREKIAQEIERTDAAIREAGYDGPIEFRPPFGKKLVGLPRYLHQHDRRTIMWDVAVEDYSGGPPQSTDDLVRLTVEGVRPGSIVLLHPWQGRTPTQAAIEPVIEELKGRGYRFVTVEQLLALR